jgi:hypothetical protein
MLEKVLYVFINDGVKGVGLKNMGIELRYVAVAIPTGMNMQIAMKDLIEKRGKPQTPCPDVHPPLHLDPIPIKIPPIIQPTVFKLSFDDTISRPSKLEPYEETQMSIADIRPTIKPKRSKYSYLKRNPNTILRIPLKPVIFP